MVERWGEVAVNVKTQAGTLLDRLANDPRIRRQGLTPEQRTMVDRVRRVLGTQARLQKAPVAQRA